jgi:hypothetical protein
VANKTFWTPDNRARLDAMVRKGALLVPLEKAAEILGTSFATVHTEITRRSIKTFARHTFDWTDARLKTLRAMLDDGGNLILPRANAARILGCDRSTLIGGLIRLQGGTTGKVDLTRLKGLATADGDLILPKHEAARSLGCSEKALRNAMLSAGVRGTRRFEWTPEKTALLAAMTGADGRLREAQAHAAARIGCSQRALQQRLSMIKRQRAARAARIRAKTDTSPVGTLLAAMRGWLPRVTPMHVAAAVRAEPRLATLDAAWIGHRLRALAAIYKIAENDALRMALSAPGLFVADLPELRSNLRDAPKALGLDANAYARIIRTKPALALIGRKAMASRVWHLCLLLDDKPKKVISLGLRHPHLLTIPSEELRTRRKALAAALRLPQHSIAVAIRRQPNVLRYTSDILADHCRKTAQLTGASMCALTEAFIQNPAVLQVKPETIQANMRATAQLLERSTAEITASFLGRPPLLTMRPAFIAQKVHALAGIFEISHAHMTKKVLAYPYLLSFAVENTAEKVWLLVRLSEAVDKPATPAQILDIAPMAFSYAKERIAVRVEMARAGLGSRSIGAMLSMSDRQAEKLKSSQPA